VPWNLVQIGTQPRIRRGVRAGRGRGRSLARVLFSFGAVGAAVLPGGILPGSPGGLAAQVSRDTLPPDSVVFVLGRLEVRVARPVVTVGAPSGIAVRLDSLRLGPAPALDGALRQVPFVQVRENSRGEAQLALRGVEARQVAVLVDGVPLTLGWDHRTDLSVVPLTGAQSLTLVRGLASVLHGPNVLGGVVEVGVAHGRLAAPEVRPLRTDVGVGEAGARSVAVVVGRGAELGSGGELVVRGGAGYRERDGVPLPGGVVDPGASDGLRGNSDAQTVDGFVAVRYRGAPGAQGEGSWLALSASGFRSERGVPPELHVAEPRFWRYPALRRTVVALSGGTGQRATPFGVGDLEASVGVDLGRTEIDSYGDWSYGEVVERELGDDRTLTFRLLGDHTLGPQMDLRAALTLAETRHDETLSERAGSGWDSVERRYRQRLWSLGAELERRLGGAGWLSGARVSLGAVVDGADTPESGDKPPLGRLWEWGGRVGVTAAAAGGRALVHAGASRRARFPALRELYSGALGRFAPNPELRPEILAGAEAGVSSDAGALRFQAVGFYQRLSGAIVRVALPDRRLRRENRDELRSVGLELLAGWAAGPLSVSAEATLQRVRLREPRAEGSAFRRPEYQPGFFGGLDVGAALPLGARGSFAVRHVGRQWCVHPDEGRDVALDPSTRLDLELSRGWTLGGPGLERLEAAVALDNATDAAAYDQCGLPQPGRTLRVQLRLR